MLYINMPLDGTNTEKEVATQTCCLLNHVTALSSHNRPLNEPAELGLRTWVAILYLPAISSLLCASGSQSRHPYFTHPVAYVQFFQTFELHLFQC